MKYLCFCCEDEKSLDALSESEWRALREETYAYVDTMREKGQLVDARPLKSASMATTVRVREGRLSTTDGPFAETKEQIGGYFLVEARDLNEAIQIAALWPAARFGSVEVRPVEEELPHQRRYE